MNRNSKQAMIVAIPNGDVEDVARLKNAVAHAQHPAVIFLEYQKIVRSNERHRCRTIQAGNQLTDFEVWISHGLGERIEAENECKK